MQLREGASYCNKRSYFKDSFNTDLSAFTLSLKRIYSDLVDWSVNMKTCTGKNGKALNYSTFCGLLSSRALAEKCTQQRAWRKPSEQLQRSLLLQALLILQGLVCMRGEAFIAKTHMFHEVSSDYAILY